MLAVRIAGLGWYLPQRRVSNAELAEPLGVPPEWIERATGVRERRYVSDESSLSMAVAASRMALADAGIALEEVDAIIGASTGPEQAAPCTAALAQAALGAPDGASACFDINATCLSFLFATRIAAHLIAAGAYRNVLIFSSELASRSLNHQEAESSVLFGDAAAAAALRASAPDESSAICHARFETYASGAGLTQIIGGGTRHHPNDPTTTPEMNLFRMDGPSIFKYAARLMGPFLDRFFEPIGWTREDVDVLIPHQASRHAVMQLSSRLGFRADQVYMNLAERGNCVAASIPLALAEAVSQGCVRRGDRVLLAGTGAGLTLGAMALTY